MICNMPNLQGIGITNCNMNTYDPQDLNMSTSQGLESSSILYGENLSMNSNSWDGNALPIFIFSTTEFQVNSKNMYTSLLHIANFIHNIKLEGKIEKDFLFLSGFGEATRSFLLFIYKVG